MLKSREIDLEIKKQKAKLEAGKGDIRVLLLGTGDSGKTTVLKQLELIHGTGFSSNLAEYKRLASHFIVRNMSYLAKTVDLKGETHDSAMFIDDQAHVANATELSDEVANAIVRLWELPQVKEASRKLHHSLEWFAPKAQKFADPSYEMSNQGNRKAWMQFFDDSNAIMFVTSLTFYSEYLRKDEDPKRTNALIDSVNCFKEINQSRMLKHSLNILLLSKFDLLGTRMAQSPIGDFFPEHAEAFKGDGTDEEKRAWSNMVIKMFKTASPEKREFMVHVASCNNTQAVSVILASVTGHILSKVLTNAGILF